MSTYLRSVATGDPPSNLVWACSRPHDTSASRGGSTPTVQARGSTHSREYRTMRYTAGGVIKALWSLWGVVYLEYRINTNLSAI